VPRGRSWSRTRARGDGHLARADRCHGGYAQDGGAAGDRALTRQPGTVAEGARLGARFRSGAGAVVRPGFRRRCFEATPSALGLAVLRKAGRAFAWSDRAKVG
jgi:hypothetical protein